MAVTPYVVGQWVRGESFYGREVLIREILQGKRNCLWILGTRRIGQDVDPETARVSDDERAGARLLPGLLGFSGCGDAGRSR